MILTRKAEPQAKSLLQPEQIGGGHTAKASRHVGSVEGKQPSFDPTLFARLDLSTKNLIHNHPQAVMFVVVDGNKNHAVLGQQFS